MEFTDRRRLLWEALSELYLDTELSEQDVMRLRAKIVQSGYSLTQVKDINYIEIAPVLYPNLISTAGIWTSFDIDWLTQQIERRGSRPARFLGSRRLWKRCVDYLVGADLDRLLA